MNQRSSPGFVAFAMVCCTFWGVAHAADPLPAETRLVAASNAPVTLYGTPSNQPASFSIANPEDLVVTLTDLKIPSALASAGVVVTQAGAIAGSALLAAPATTATVSLPAANGNYTLYVFGVPDSAASVGTFTACVAPKVNPSNCIQSASLSGNITSQSTAKDPTVSTLSTNLSVTTSGSYTFTFADLQFPAALSTAPSVVLSQGSTVIFPPGQTTNPAITSGTSLNLSAGTYTVFAIAQADQTIKSGLYGITISGPAGVAPLLNAAIPVGLSNVAASFNNPSAQSVTLKVTDYGFPGALASASALLTAGGTAVGTASAAGGAASFAAPAGTLQLWTYGNAGATAGTFSADVSAGSTDLYTAAQGIQAATVPSTYAYAFVVPQPLLAGAYQATAADLQFPSQLSGVSFAVAQNGLIAKQSAAAGTVNFTAIAGTAILLVSAQAPSAGSASGSGLFDVNLQTSGTSAQLVYDMTQRVGNATLFDSQTLTVGVNASFDVSLTDLKFPAQFSNLALVVSRGSEFLGKAYGGGLFTFPASPGTYQLTFVATPATQPPQQVGLYGVSIVYSPPAITLSSSATTAVTGTAITLSWSFTNAVSCAASGGSWMGSKNTSSGTESVVLDATTTYKLACTGDGGTTSQSVTVAATAKPSSSGGGGGALGLGFLALGCVLASIRMAKYTHRDARQA